MRSILSILEKEYGLKDILSTVKTQQRLLANWSSVFGKLAGELEFQFLRNGVLGIGVFNPIWKTEIIFHEKLILEKANQLLTGKNKVTRLKITLISKGVKSAEKTAGKTSVRLPFPEKIRLENEVKRKKGWTLCTVCQVQYTDSGICLFCKHV